MALHPDIARMADAAPPMPPLDSMDIADLRGAVNAAIARIPKLDVALADIRDCAVAGADGPIGARIYTPVGTGPFPLLVFFHSGGWVVGDLETSDNLCRGLAAGASSMVLSVDYRLAPEHPFPAPADDAWAALQWAFQNAVGLGADPSRIAIGGESAGGNLAAGVALRARDAGMLLRAQVLLYSSPDYPDPNTESFLEYAEGSPGLRSADSLFYWSRYLSDIEDRHNPLACPARAASHAGLPPTYSANGECDPSRDLGERYAELLRRAGTLVVARRYEGMPHGFLAYAPFIPATREILDEIAGWLRQQVRPSART